MIKVQREDFDVGREIAALSDGNHAVGGLAVFVGLVRDMAEGQPVGAMTLEHYPGTVSYTHLTLPTTSRV